jgi:hypothetical protein
VVFSEDAAAAPMQQALEAGVSAYVISGLQAHRLLPVLQVAIARFEQDRLLRGQLEVAQSQLSERKVVDRAKGMLMDEIGLTEEQAFAHLRKLAMDRGQRLGQVAERIVAARDLLHCTSGGHFVHGLVRFAACPAKPAQASRLACNLRKLGRATHTTAWGLLRDSGKGVRPATYPDKRGAAVATPFLFSALRRSRACSSKGIS